MPASFNPEAYRFDSNELHRELIQTSLVRTIGSVNIRQELDYLTDDKYRYYKEILDSNPQVDVGEIDGDRRRADMSVEYVDVDVPSIEEGLSYSRAQVAKIAKGKLPMSDRVNRVVRKMAEVEERFFFAGDPMADSQGAYHITDSNNHTDWSTDDSDSFDTENVGTMRTTLGHAVGKLIDNYKGRLRSMPLFLTLSPDVYKEVVLTANSNTDASAIDLLTNDLKANGMNTALPSHVFVSEYLFGQTGALDYDGEDVVLETAGTEAAALIAGDPDAWRIETSPLDQNPWDQGGNLRMDFGYRFLPYFKKADAVIYDDNVELAAQTQ